MILLQLVRGVRGFLHPMPGLESPDELLVGFKAGVRGPRQAEQLPQHHAVGPDVRLKREHPADSDKMQ